MVYRIIPKLPHGYRLFKVNNRFEYHCWVLLLI